MLEPAGRAEALIESRADGILILDTQGLIRWASPSVRRYGLQPEELFGRAAGECLHGGDAVRFQAALTEALASPGNPISVKLLRLRSADGKGLCADDTLTFLPRSAGIDGVLLSIHAGGSLLPARERQLRETEEQLRQVVRLSHIGVFDHDHRTGEVYWSPEIRRIYGWGATEPVVALDKRTTTTSTWNVIHPQDRDRVARSVQEAHDTQGDGLFDVEYRIVRRDGELRWLSTRSQTFFEGEGAERRPVRTVGAVQDITARKQTERQIELMQMSVDRCSTAIYWVSSVGQVTYANDRACESLGVERSELVGKYVWEFDPDCPPAVWQASWEQVRRDKAITMQTRHRRKDGTLFPIDILGTYLNFDGEEELVFVFAQDTTERERAERELRLMHAAIEKSHTPFFEVSPAGRIIYANEHACRSLGYTREELTSKAVWDIDPGFPPESQRRAWADVYQASPIRFETSHRRKDGSIIPVEVTSNYFSYKDEQYALSFAQDITERRNAERALRWSEERLQQVAHVYNIGLFEHDHLTNGVYWSAELRKYWGLRLDDPVNADLFAPAIHPDDLPSLLHDMERAHDPAGDGRYSVQHRIIHPDGSLRWIDTRSQTFFEGEGGQRHPVRTVGALVDVTARVMAEEALRHSLKEKETLLREVHHRVKNNLQIIASLLHFQAKRVKNPDDLAAFSEGRNRLRSMILVHEKLYQSPDLSRIDFGSYIRALARDLQRSYLTTGRNVGVRIAADALAVPIESAVPCGMILCELLTNVFKYAFPDGRSGTADVSVTAANGQMYLSVSDDGVGLPADFDPEHSSSFGWQLIRNLTAQLGGTATVGRTEGTQVSIAFPR